MIKELFGQIDAFQIARVKLTLWYILISLLLLVVFTIAAIGVEKRSFAHLQSILADPIQRPYLTALLDQRFREYETDFRRRLLQFDLVLLLISSALSYFLSGRTLKPIQEMVKEQEEFSADASHELRTPLTTIRMEIEALRRTEKNIPHKYQTVLNSVQEEVARMKNIVDGLLVLVRGHYLDQKPNLQLLDLTELCQKCLQQLSPLALEKNIRINFQDNSGKNQQILSFGEQVKQVILILLDNAIKYTPTGGEVTITLRSINSGVLLAVSDCGIGISPEDLPHIFERFYRSKDAELTGKGTGLGLAIAKKLTTGLRGNLTAASIPKKGSTFTLTLPNHS